MITPRSGGSLRTCVWKMCSLPSEFGSWAILYGSLALKAAGSLPRTFRCLRARLSLRRAPLSDSFTASGSRRGAP